MNTCIPVSSFRLRVLPVWPAWFSWFRPAATGLLTLLTCALVRAETVVVINELDADQVGEDLTEFIELYAYDSVSSLAAPNASLDGYVVVLYNGSNDTTYSFTLDGVASSFQIALTGKTTNAQGFLLIGSPGMPGATFQLTNPGFGWLQQGPDAVALYKNPTTNFSAATLVTSLELVDAVVYDTADADDPGLLAALTPGQPQVDENALGTFASVAMARTPDGGAPFNTAVFALVAPTPGSLNQPANALTLTLAPLTLAEGAVVSATVSRNGPTTSAATVTLTTSDNSEATTPATVEIPAGSASAPVPITGADDAWPDGSQTAIIAAASPGYLPTEITVTVTDNGDTVQPLIINEVYATGRTDANADGETNSGVANQANFNDEFIEMVNQSAADVDLTGFTLFESVQATARHTFPPGTVLSPGCALVVFGGGNASLALGITPAFGNAWVQKANAPTNGTYLLEPTDRLSLRNVAGIEIAGMTYDNQTGAVDSVTRDPDKTGAFVPHGSVGQGALAYSPGTKNDGTSFCAITNALTLSFAPATVVESAGAGATTLTVSRPATFTNQVVVSVLSGDTTEAVASAPTVTIPAGQASATVPINAVDDTAQDATQAVAFTCIGAGYLNGTSSLEVTDDGRDVPPAGVFINEIDSDQPGTDGGEFIELYIGEPAVRALDGYIVVLFNGANTNPGNAAYLVLDLADRVTTPQGFFVLGNAAVPGVAMVFPDNSLQNGADAVAVYRTAAANFQTSGTPTPPSNSDLIDVVVYGNGQTDDTDLLTAFQGAAGLPALAQQSEGTGNNTDALARLPDATTPFGNYTAQVPTPGATNGLSPLTGYDLWASGFPGLGGRSEDPDLDGFANVAEYAVGGQPLTGAPSTTIKVTTNPTGKPRITISKGTIASTDPKLSYVVESSTDLTTASWGIADMTVVTNTTTELVVDYAGPAATAFLRFKAVLLP